MGLEAKKIFQSKFSWMIVALDELQGRVIAGMIISLFVLFSFSKRLDILLLTFCFCFTSWRIKHNCRNTRNLANLKERKWIRSRNNDF